MSISSSGLYLSTKLRISVEPAQEPQNSIEEKAINELETTSSEQEIIEEYQEQADSQS